MDPIGLAGGLNQYGYAGGDPINNSDPFGLCPPEDDNKSDCTTNQPTRTKTDIALGPGGGSVTVTNEYAPLSQDQVDWLATTRDLDAKNAGIAEGLLVGAGINATPLGPTAGLLVGTGVAVMRNQKLDYNPRVGDQITTSVQAGFGASTSKTQTLVTRSDGSSVRLPYRLWSP